MAQWNGTHNQIGDLDWLAGDTSPLDAPDAFSRSWADAAGQKADRLLG